MCERAKAENDQRDEQHVECRLIEHVEPRNPRVAEQIFAEYQRQVGREGSGHDPGHHPVVSPRAQKRERKGHRADHVCRNENGVEGLATDRTVPQAVEHDRDHCGHQRRIRHTRDASQDQPDDDVDQGHGGEETRKPRDPYGRQEVARVRQRECRPSNLVGQELFRAGAQGEIGNSA